MHRLIFLGLLVIAASASAAELTGRVIDAVTTEAIVGVNIRIVGTERGTTTDVDGQFRLNIDQSVDLRFSYIGYETQPVAVEYQTGQFPKLLIRLKPTTLASDEISVVGKFPTLNKNPEVSTHYFDRREVTGISGTVDDLTRTIQSLPGVVAQADFSGKMYVRGGKAEENLVLLDRTFIYEPYHLAGLVSIFNPDLIEDVEFFAGGYPAQYGQAMSSVLEVENRIGDRDRVKGEASLSLISADAVASGPLPGEKGSWLVSARQSYQHKLMKALGQFEDHVLPSFHDYQGKIFYPLSDKHLLTANFLLSGDHSDLEVSNPDSVLDVVANDGRFFWDNRLFLFSLDWKFLPTQHIFTHTTMSIVDQDFESRVTSVDPDWVIARPVHYDFREDISILSIPHHKLEIGTYIFTSDVFVDMRWKQSIFLENITENSNAGIDSTRFKTQFYRTYRYLGGYLQDTWEILPPQVSISYGLRAEYMNHTDDFTLSPRFSLAWQYDERTLFKAAWGVFHQFSRDAVQTDNDIGNPNLTAQKAIHYIAGLERQVSDNVKSRVEFFLKDLTCLITLDSLINFSNEASGHSYGVEFFLQKRLSGNFDGWGSYTYSVTKRRDGPGLPLYHPLQDQRHTLSLVLNYRFGRGWRLSAKGTFYTGKPYTPVLSAAPVMNPLTGEPLFDPGSGFPIYQPVEGAINSDRFPAYRRLDLRLAKDFVFRGYDWNWFVEVMNVTNHQNVFDYTYRYDYTDRKTISQFPLLPTVGLTWQF